MLSICERKMKVSFSMRSMLLPTKGNLVRLPTQFGTADATLVKVGSLRCRSLKDTSDLLLGSLISTCVIGF